MKTRIFPEMLEINRSGSPGLRRGIAALSFLMIVLAPAAWAQKTWIGASGDGGVGDWVGENFNPGGLPTTATSGTANNVQFDNEHGPLVNATVTIRSGVAAKARQLLVKNKKVATIELENNSSLTVNDGIIGVGGGSTVQGDMSLAFIGPETGLASITGTRLYLEGDNINAGTSYMKALTLSGNLNVNLTTSYSGVSGRASITVLDGVNITTAGGAGQFYIRTGGKAANSNIYDNRISILGGSVAANLFVVSSSVSGSVGSGLLQMGSAAQITRGAGAAGLEVEVRNGGRFEAAGAGLSSEALIDVQGGGTLAVGVTDQVTGLRGGAEIFTLSADATFAANSYVEFSLFGSGAEGADHIVIGETGSFKNPDAGAGAQLVLKLNGGFAPAYGESWSLFTVDENSAGITGDFNFSQIDQNLWDLSNFNEAGNWTVMAIPEPSALGLLAVAGAIGVALARRKK